MKRSVWAIGQRCLSSSQIGNGSLTHSGRKWSKSVAQSLTGGRSLIAAPSRLDDFDGELGAVRLGEVGLFLQPRRHRAVALLARVAVLVELEQLRGQRLAAVVSLALVAIDADFQGRLG